MTDVGHCTRGLSTLHEWCGCQQFCADMPEDQDAPNAVCKKLPDAPRQPLVEFVLVHRNTGEVV